MVLHLVVAFFALHLAVQPPGLDPDDRVRLAEAFHLADSVQDSVWPGWRGVPFAVLLVTEGHEFLLRHPRPSDDFALVADYDSLLGSAVYVRERQYDPSLLATFPAVGGLPTVVVGQPSATGRASTEWVLTVLHEHFHQFQFSQPGYYEDTAALDLAGGDESGMWMLNYPFPYASDTVGAHMAVYRDALVDALDHLDVDAHLSTYRKARAQWRAVLSDADYRYFSFQLWAEGVARYIELRVATAAAERHDPLPEFLALSDAISYAEAARSARRRLAQELAALDLASWGRVAFYPLGAAEALLLDAAQPGWQRRYTDEPFYLERYLDSGELEVQQTGPGSQQPE
ncbi:MAG: hypothetical protein AAF170_05380 [Bacteroidota bacterium]